MGDWQSTKENTEHQCDFPREMGPGKNRRQADCLFCTEFHCPVYVFPLENLKYYNITEL